MEGLRIVSDGTAEGTHVYLDDTEVRDVTNVTWNFSPRNRKTYVTLEISNVAMEAVSDIEAQTRSAIEVMQGGLRGAT